MPGNARAWAVRVGSFFELNFSTISWGQPLWARSPFFLLRATGPGPLAGRPWRPGHTCYSSASSCLVRSRSRSVGGSIGARPPRPTAAALISASCLGLLVLSPPFAAPNANVKPCLRLVGAPRLLHHPVRLVEAALRAHRSGLRQDLRLVLVDHEPLGVLLERAGLSRRGVLLAARDLRAALAADHEAAAAREEQRLAVRAKHLRAPRPLRESA